MGDLNSHGKTRITEAAESVGIDNRGMGRVVLIKDEELAWQHDLQRPNDGVVADSGHSAINDWLFGDRLNGTFYVFGANSEPIIKSHFLANLINCGLSDDGSVAWCATARSDSERDSQRLAIFTTSPAKSLFKTDVLYGDVSQVRLSEGEVHVKTDQDIEYRFSLQGKILNEDLVNTAIDKAQIEKGSSWDLLSIVDSRRKSDDSFRASKQVDELFALLNLALERTDDPRMIAIIERRKGEIRLELADREQALVHFRKALQLDPKIGIKRLAAKIERELGT